MLLLRLSGHSGAGKSRLLAALMNNQFKYRRPVICTSRPPRAAEVHGRDYYFMSRGSIESLPADRFLVGDVRQSVQAIDLSQIEFDLRSGDPVIVEIFHTRWPLLKKWLVQRFGTELKIASVFLTAVSPQRLAAMPETTAKAHIREEIARILNWRGKDAPSEIKLRADTAVTEIVEAIHTPGLYDRILFSAPEGPDGKDDWTIDAEPRGQAAQALKEFLAFTLQVEPTLPSTLNSIS